MKEWNGVGTYGSGVGEELVRIEKRNYNHDIICQMSTYNERKK